MRAKLNSLLNYVDKGLNKGQLRDFSLFLRKSDFNVINYDIFLVYTFLFLVYTMLKSDEQSNPEMSFFSDFIMIY